MSEKAIRNLEEKVLVVLADDPPSRDSDIRLMIQLWIRNCPDKLMPTNNGSYAVVVDDLYELPREDHVKRIRAKIQNEEPRRFPPTSWEVARQRKWEEAEWRRYVGTQGDLF